MKRPLHWAAGGESGQTMAIVAMSMVVLLGVVGLVVDVGNAYALQRKVRNAVDAAALAGAGELAKHGSTTNANVLAAVRRYASLNTLQEANVQAWYCDLDGNALQPVNNDSFSPPADVSGTSVAGVLVRGNGTVNAYLAHLVGVDSFTSAAESMGWVSCGTCEAGDLFPAGIGLHTFSSNGGVPLVGPPYTFWGDKTAAGNFGWLSWNADPSNPVLVGNINHPSNSGRWRVGDWIPCGPGVMSSSGVAAALDDLIQSGRNEVTVPVYSAVRGTGSSVEYQVAGFVRLRITGYNFQGRDKYLVGEFLRWVDGSGEGGCADLGVCTVKLRQPMTEERAIAGVVSVWEPNLTGGVAPAESHAPVDVVHVVDLSGSMADRWASGQEAKLATVKRAVTELNNALLPAEGDQVGLVSYPVSTYGQWYSPLCTAAWTNTYYGAQVLSPLTSSVATVNGLVSGLAATGGASTAAGMQLGRFTALPNELPTPGRAPVVILASDGLSNCTVDGRWTGFSGDGADSPACNAIAQQHAIEQANLAKQAGVIVFTVAVGGGFDTDFLQAMATEDSDASRPHFFQAGSRAELESIYQAIALRLNDTGQDCDVEEFESAGSGAVVSIYKNGSLYAQTTASDTGSYVFPDVDPGTYTFSVSMSRNGLTFDTMTDVIGGPEAPSAPTVTVGASVGTYIRDLYLRSSTPLICF